LQFAVALFKGFQFARIVEVRVLALFHKFQHVEGESVDTAFVPRGLQHPVAIFAHAQRETRAIQRRVHVAIRAQQLVTARQVADGVDALAGKASRAWRAASRRALVEKSQTAWA
jgi:hypothetical protein